jgi:hypothetical protein
MGTSMRFGWIAAASVAVLTTGWLGLAQDAPQPDPEKDLTKRLEAALQEVEALRGQVDQQQESLLASAREIRLLRQSNEGLRAELESLQNQLKSAVAERSAAGSSVENVTHGPKDPMMGVVIAIGRDFGFVLATIEQKSERDTIKMDYGFNIERRGKLVARGSVTKIITDPESKSLPKVQIKITRGNVDDVQVGDTVAALREVVIGRNPEGAPQAAAPARISGVFGKDLYAFDRGRNHNLRVGERAYVYRDKELIAVLRLEMVDPEMSIGRVEAGKRKDPMQGDIVEFEHVGLGEKVEIFGRVLYAEREIILDVGTRHRCRPGQKFEVRRNGQKVGELRIKDARADTAIAEPSGATKKADIQKGDLVELVQD